MLLKKKNNNINKSNNNNTVCILQNIVKNLRGSKKFIKTHNNKRKGSMTLRRDCLYYFIENEAFTEDAIRIYNIFVYKISPDITDNDLQNYFNKYGEIRRITTKRPVQRKYNYVKDMAFIYYSDPKSAAMALRCTHHIIKKKRVFVTACYSWLQPEAVEHQNINTCASISSNSSKQEENKMINTESERNSPLNIRELNDDVLRLICSYLDITDEIAMAQTSEYFHNIFILSCAPKYKVLNMVTLQDLTLWQARNFLQLCGPYITTLEGPIPRRGRHRIAEFCGSYCTNVTTIRISSLNFKPILMEKLLYKMTAVTEIEITYNGLNDYSICLMGKLQQLKVLRTKANSNISGKYLPKLIHLEELCVEACINIKQMYIKESLKVMKNLRILDIQSCNISNNVFSEFIDLNIEVLKMSTAYDTVAQFPKLKHLVISAYNRTRSNILNNLVKYRHDQLEVLVFRSNRGISQRYAKYIGKLYALKTLSLMSHHYEDNNMLKEFIQLQQLEKLRLVHASFFNEMDLLKLLKYCHQLKYLNIIHCTQITDNFVFKAINILEDLYITQQRIHPLHIMACSSGINDRMERTPELRDKQHILKLYFSVRVTNANDFFDGMEDFYYTAFLSNISADRNNFIDDLSDSEYDSSDDTDDYSDTTSDEIDLV